MLYTLPKTMLEEIISFLPMNFYPILLQVARNLIEKDVENHIWYVHYCKTFVHSTEYDNYGNPIKCYYDAYKKRLSSPFIGDDIEVAWQGRFRLDGMVELYNGMSWWGAKVTEKNMQTGQYRINYPGWESRWDEWVPFNRIRSIKTQQQKPPPPYDMNATPEEFHVNDIVEIWFQGRNVPGAWIKSRIIGVNERSYVIEGYVGWVNKDRVRRLNPNSVSVLAVPNPNEDEGGYIYINASDLDDRMPNNDQILPPPPSPLDNVNDVNSSMITDDFEQISHFVERENLEDIAAFVGVNTLIPYNDINVNHNNDDNDTNSNESTNSSSFYLHAYHTEDMNTCNLM